MWRPFVRASHHITLSPKLLVTCRLHALGEGLAATLLYEDKSLGSRSRQDVLEFRPLKLLAV